MMRIYRKICYICRLKGEKEIMANTQTKKINWLFPDPDTKVTEEDFEKEIRRAERSGSMTFEEFERRMNQWRQENL